MLLAWHFREGKNYIKALEYFGIAGETAFHHYCPQETIILLQEALKISEKVLNPPLLSLVKWNRMLGDSFYFQGNNKEAKVHLIKVLQLTKCHSRDWRNLNKGKLKKIDKFLNLLVCFFKKKNNFKKILFK